MHDTITHSNYIDIVHIQCIKELVGYMPTLCMILYKRILYIHVYTQLVTAVYTAIVMLALLPTVVLSFLLLK